jgi:hypothetical protein
MDYDVFSHTLRLDYSAWVHKAYSNLYLSRKAMFDSLELIIHHFGRTVSEGGRYLDDDALSSQLMARWCRYCGAEHRKR